MKQLTNTEAVALWNWAVAHKDENWGGWDNYPVSGCSYLQFDNNPIVVKFDTTVSYGGETFRRIGWGRRIPGNDAAITFGALYDLIPADVRPAKGEAPSCEFTHPNGNVFILTQSPYSDYKRHRFSVRYPDGKVRDNFTTASKLYGQMLECKPADVVIY